MFTREEYVAICSHCTNRKFDPKHGVICGLTDAPADFVEQCHSFNEDQVIGNTTRAIAKSEEQNVTYKTRKNLMSGILMIVGGILGGTFTNTDEFYGLVLIGIIILFLGISKVPQKKN